MSVCKRHAPDEVARPPPTVIIGERSQGVASIAHPSDAIGLYDYCFFGERVSDLTPTTPTTLTKGKFVSAFDVFTVSPPRAKILELLRPEDPGKDALEAIVRPAPRRGLARPYDEDTKRFLQRALVPNFLYDTEYSRPTTDSETSERSERSDVSDCKTERSLAEELREAEEEERSGASLRRELLEELRKNGGGVSEAMERDRLGKLALSVEEDEDVEDCGLSAAARRLDALLAESRCLHEELAGIHEDIQMQCARAGQCCATARALTAESKELRYLDDVVALLRGDVTAAGLTRQWPFAFGRRHPDRNYIV